jgi:hypothetical protein
LIRWNYFLEEINEKINDNFNIKWIEDLPRQTDSDDLPLPDHLRQLVDKEQDKRPVRYLIYFSMAKISPENKQINTLI